MRSGPGMAPVLDRSRTSEKGARARSRHGCEVQLIAEPRELDEERVEQIDEAVADLAWRACGGEAGRDDPSVGRGWREYCTSPGGRANDHDRLVLFWDDGRMVGFNGLVVSRMPQAPAEGHQEATLLWWRAAGTDPAYQAKGIFGAACSTMLDPDWLTSFGGPTYWVYRTPNPVIHESVRKWWHRHPHWAERLYPPTPEQGELEPIDPATRAVAARIASHLWPDSPFDPDTFVL